MCDLTANTQYNLRNLKKIAQFQSNFIIEKLSLLIYRSYLFRIRPLYNLSQFGTNKATQRQIQISFAVYETEVNFKDRQHSWVLHIEM